MRNLWEDFWDLWSKPIPVPLGLAALCLIVLAGNVVRWFIG